MNNHDDTQISVVDTSRDDIIPLKNVSTEESLDITRTEKKFLIQEAQGT